MVVPFKLSVVKDSNKAERALANAVVDQVLKKKDSLIGLATGQTMIGVYKTLVEEEKKNIGLFQDTVFVQLDEIIPKAETDRLFFPKSYRKFFLIVWKVGIIHFYL
jgi:glucosamine-6-phosphate deaminase